VTFTVPAVAPVPTLLRFFQPLCVTSPNALLDNFRVADNTEVFISSLWDLGSSYQRAEIGGENAAFVASSTGQMGYISGSNRVIACGSQETT
jgi:hypothetical protein